MNRTNRYITLGVIILIIVAAVVFGIARNSFKAGPSGTLSQTSTTAPTPTSSSKPDSASTPKPSVSSSNVVATATPKPKSQTVSGVITKIFTGTPASGSMFTVTPKNSSTSVNVLVNKSTKISGPDNKPRDISDIQKGFTISATGQENKGAITATSILVTNEPNIIIFTPTNNQKVNQNITVTGAARVFENQFSIRLTDTRTGAVLIKKAVNSNAPDAGKYGQFSYTLSIPASADIKSGDNLNLEAYDNSPKDGSEIDKVIVPLTYQP